MYKKYPTSIFLILMCVTMFLISPVFVSVGCCTPDDKDFTDKDNIGIYKDANPDDFTITKTKEELKIKSSKHYETYIKIPYSEIEELEGFTGTININHYTDSGFNDWSKTIYPENKNGYVYLNLEFSEVVITVGESIITNWNFETWSSGETEHTPDGWTTSTPYACSASNTYYKIGSKSLKFTNEISETTVLEQTVTDSLELNHTYVFDYWYYIPASMVDQSQYFQVYVRGYDPAKSFVGTTYNDATDGWQHESKTFVFDTDCTYTKIRLLFSSTAPDGYVVYIDGITIYELVDDLDAVESYDSENIYLNFTGCINKSDVDNIVITEFSEYDLTQHGLLGVPTFKMNETNKTGYLADSMVYIETAGAANGTYNFNVTIPYNLPPSLISPTNGSTVEREFPPLYDDVTFIWEDTGTTCQIQVSEDSAFSNVVYTGETAAHTKTVSLAEGTYYWRVRSYDAEFQEYGAWPDTYNFVIVVTSSVSGTGVHGVVFEAESLGSSIPLPSTLVTLYNETYSDTAITGPEGYYQFFVSNGTYSVYATTSGYDTTPAFPVTVSGDLVILNIPMRLSDSYFAPHDVNFIVYDSATSATPMSGASYAVYEGDGTTAIKTGVTGYDGGFAVADMSPGTLYRIVIVSGETTVTKYVEPWGTQYSLILDTSEIETYFDNWVSISFGTNGTGILTQGTATYTSTRDLDLVTFRVMNATGIQYITNDTEISGSFISPVLSSGSYTMSVSVLGSDGAVYTRVTTYRVGAAPGTFLPDSYPDWLKNAIMVFILLITVLSFGKSRSDVAVFVCSLMASFAYWLDWLIVPSSAIWLMWLITGSALMVRYKLTRGSGY